MRVVSWNMRRANRTSSAWKILIDLKPDVALLQEVSGIPSDVEQSFDVNLHNAVTRNNTPQRFGTAILVKGTIVGPLPLSSEYDWVNQELKRFEGNLVACTDVTGEFCTRGNVRETVTEGAGEWHGRSTVQSRSSPCCDRSKSN
jgi:exonuclease III